MGAPSSLLKQYVEDALAERFGAPISVGRDLLGMDELARIAGHRSHRT